MREKRIRINNQIRVRELRVITDDGENLGVLSLENALEEAKSRDLDLIEISPNTQPPVAKIIDYGKFQYQQKKKLKEARASSHAAETKSIQIKIGTSEHDLGVKAKKASLWLKDGHRVKIELYLVGRTKYTDIAFKKERLGRILNRITEEYTATKEAQKSPKGLAIIIEPIKKAK